MISKYIWDLITMYGICRVSMEICTRLLWRTRGMQ